MITSLYARTKHILPTPFKVLVYEAVNRIRYWNWRRNGELLPEVSYQDLTGKVAPDSISQPILDDGCMPPYSMFGAMHDDFHPLMGILLKRNSDLVLELGTAHGNTVANICKLLPHSKVVTVNAPIDNQTGDIITFELDKTEIGRVYRQHGYTSQVTQILSNTLTMNLTETLEENSVDVAIIDACHDTPYVINDFHKVRTFIKPGGVVFFHDTHPSLKGHLLGSYRACVNLRKEGYAIQHLMDTYWGIWVKPDQKQAPST